MEEKRELVYEVSKWSQGAPELLQSWSRQEILEILCAEMGKERKYTGLTKLKIIEILLKVVSEKRSHEKKALIDLDQRVPKRPRKSDHPSRPTVATDTTIGMAENDLDINILCKNSACRAKQSQREYVFCKRCSCCVCHQYDDNKDPSLWLTCSSEPPFQGNSCGMSCHLECALPHERSGIGSEVKNKRLDGSFYCLSCGKVNDLLGCWRKQVITARDTRRVDILCYRVSLSRKILSGTKGYQKLDEIIHEAMIKLEAELGPITGLPVKWARGIVNRLSSGQEVQKLCASAVDSLDSILSNISFNLPSASANPKSLTANASQVRDTISVEVESNQSPATNSSSVSNPSSVEDENNAGNVYKNENDIQKKSILADLNDDVDCNGMSQHGTRVGSLSMLDVISAEKVNSLLSSGVENLEKGDLSESLTLKDDTTVAKVNSLPITPSKSENFKNFKPKVNNKDLINGSEREKGQQNDCSSKKKKTHERQDEECSENGDRDFGYYVKVIRWLECEGHIETSFRQKFLTWYSLRASPQEVRVVKVFVDTLVDDPTALAGQLIDTFSDVISNKKCAVPGGFCLKFRH